MLQYPQIFEYPQKIKSCILMLPKFYTRNVILFTVGQTLAKYVSSKIKKVLVDSSISQNSAKFIIIIINHS